MKFTFTSMNSLRCIQGLLKNKLIVLATHQVHFAVLADKLLVLKDVSFDSVFIQTLSVAFVLYICLTGCCGSLQLLFWINCQWL